MATGKTLSQLTEAVRMECRKSTNASRGIDDLGYLQQVIRRTYESLRDEYAWPRLRIRRDVTLSAGQRYYDFPSDLDWMNITEKPMYDYGDSWIPLDPGISPEQYSSYDSDADERSDPAQRWDIIDAGSGPQLEIWPIPASSGTVRFNGYKAMSALVDDADVCDIDDIVVVLFSAFEILGASGQKDSELKRAAAFRRLDVLKMRNASQKRIFFGNNPEQDKPRTTEVRVVYAGN